jgi:membrane protease YdiL (CAAX protease family)
LLWKFKKPIREQINYRIKQEQKTLSIYFWVYSFYFLATYFIPILVYKLMERLWIDAIRPTQSELPKTIIVLTVSVFLEEICFCRIITQKLFNNKGFLKALCVSVLIFSVTHIFFRQWLVRSFYWWNSPRIYLFKVLHLFSAFYIIEFANAKYLIIYAVI